MLALVQNNKNKTLKNELANNDEIGKVKVLNYNTLLNRLREMQQTKKTRNNIFSNDFQPEKLPDIIDMRNVFRSTRSTDNETNTHNTY